jgi:transposase-like protein
MKCRKCGSVENVKNGKRNGEQCFKCKACGFQFTKETAPGVPPDKKAHAILLYVLGLSMRSIARMNNVNASTVLYWIRNFALKVYEKPAPEGDVVIELDEMWHFIKSKKLNVGYGRHIAALPVSWLTGNAETEAPTRST